jgi:outer membrane protein assembly factor BamB
MRFLFATFLFSSLSAPSYADDSWTQFRGPAGTGISRATGLPIEWDEKTNNIVWKTAIHDKGWSSPVILGKQIWLTTAPAEGGSRWALCIDRDSGKIIHDLKLFDTPKKVYTIGAAATFNSHASPSPVIGQGRVYVHFGSAGTACLDSKTGKVLWQRTNLSCDHWRGPGSSPIIWNNLLVLTFDGYDQQYVIALDKNDGSTVWKKERTVDYKTDNGDLKKAYSTPAVFAIDGKPQLVSPTAAGTVAYDPRTGKELWKVHYPGMNAAPPPILADGKVLVTTGHTKNLVAIRPTGTGDITSSHVEWTFAKPNLVPSRPAPLLLDGLVYMISDDGFASCVEASNGKPVWTKRLGGNFSSSPVYAEGHIYIFDQDGKGHVMATGRAANLVRTNVLETGCMATPAIAGKALFVRTKTHLYRIEKK